MKTLRILGAFAAAFVLSASASALPAASAPLRITTYNPGTKSLMPVSSVLVTGAHDAILIDAQFGGSQAAAVVDEIRKSGKQLTTIYISAGDPDYYFGLDKITQAFPDAKVFATPQTVAQIKQTMAGKLAFWGPKLGADAPASLVVPQVLPGDTLELEGQQLKVMGLDGAQPDRSFVWIPSLRAVVGGVVLWNNLHVWMADTQTPQSHADWLQTLAAIDRLKPLTIVPGHYLPGPVTPLQSPAYTAGYIRKFDEEAARAKDSATLVSAMKTDFPKAAEPATLVLSAKVAKGEMKWPAE